MIEQLIIEEIDGKTSSQVFYDKNKDRRKQESIDYYKTEKGKEAQRRFRERKKAGLVIPRSEKTKKDEKQYYREYRAKIKAEIFAILGNKCTRCGFPDERALQVDHINGGGSEERKYIKGSDVYRKILHDLRNYSKEYQLLCANCNWIKRSENNENAKRYKYKD